MKALTIGQPYAELIMSGEKTIENRSWPTAYRGPLAIHAGLSREWMKVAARDGVMPRGMTENRLVFGALVGVVTLIGCVPVTQLPPSLRGNVHAFGPWCWILRRPMRLLAPLPERGRQGLWNTDRVRVIDVGGGLMVEGR